MTKYNIDVVSDTVCPWCFVGNKRLDLAIQQHKERNPHDEFAMTWHPFQLNPQASQSVDKQLYYERKFGAQRTQVMQAHLAKIGKQLGIDFAFGGKTGNTRDSHRLVYFGKTQGEDMQLRVMHEIFKAYFEKEEDITTREVLIECGVRAGLDAQQTRTWMESDKGGKEVDEEVLHAQTNLISGVPNFTINGSYEVQGAEEPAAFLQVFEQIKDSSKQDVRSTSNSALCT